MADVINPTAETKPNAVPVPDDWLSFGMESGYNPSPAEALRLFIVGPSGEGKTTALSSIPDTVILDFDRGANACPGGKAVRVPIRDYDHLIKVSEKLVADSKEGKRHWRRVGFDTVDEFVAMIKHQLETEKKVEDLTEFGSQGHGYNLILERLWSLVMDLEQAGYAWAFVGHLKTKTERNPATKQEETKLREATYPIIAGKIKTKADFKWTIYCLAKTVKVKDPDQVIMVGGQRVTVPKEHEETKKVYYLDTLTTAERDNKGRGVPTMDGKFEIPLVGGWDVFKAKYEAAVDAAKKLYQS